MAEKELVTREKLEHSGIFNFSDIYTYAYRWLTDEEGLGVTEEKYSEKVSGGTRDITVEWVASKDISDYYKVDIKLKFEVSGLTDVDVEIDGNKRKMNRGKISIEVKGILITDPKGKWESSALLRFMRDFYNKYIVPSRGEDMKDKVVSIVNDFRNSLKLVLDLTGRR